ncbi:MAG: DJ-1/PfpI family protein [Chloroflexota bacterium]|nr:DJ-1/PfpI family protein [Chloroflexota bacterium]
MFGLRAKQDLAILLYPGITALDVVGSMEVLLALNVKSRYRMVTVGERIEPIATDTSLRLVPQKSFAQVPAPFGLLVPGGYDASREAIRNDAIRRYVETAGATAGVVASVGTGSLILAEAGLLAGREATTHWAYADQLEELGARYVRRRWVDDGRFITAAGVTAGIDMALYLVGKLTNESWARTTQLVIEYEPEPPFGGIDWTRVDRDRASIATPDLMEVA